MLSFVSFINSITCTIQCSNDGLFANPDDKHSFYQCIHGIPYLMQCPAGLIWFQEKQICDWDFEKRRLT